ncbi:hypothetical protein [Guptibacillus algicola]|uniref:hypothetical protein n=1 Tax=Guptibacillus algicola TaxID=225844 RepID=UPI001CD30177|nr:hypothetical protein [Alkalihalobacillus algicola]MCA0986707.1 hypothetical protein [Alkalihalobacillus algicola]
MNERKKLIAEGSEKLLASVREEIAEEFLVMEAVNENVQEKDFFTYHLLKQAEELRSKRK